MLGAEGEFLGSKDLLQIGVIVETLIAKIGAESDAIKRLFRGEGHLENFLARSPKDDRLFGWIRRIFLDRIGKFSDEYFIYSPLT